jgi:hypothetical protein
MAVQAKAKGNGPATGMQKTPPPDVVTNIRSPGQAGYGQNGPQPSSIDSGKRVLSPLAANLESSVDDDGVLKKILSRPRGALDAGSDDQTRVIDDKGYPAAHGQVSRQANSGSPGGTIPATIGATSAPTVRKPTV